MQFIVFIPGDDRADPKKLIEVGLGHLVPGAIFLPIASGPTGTRGVNVSWCATDQYHYEPGKQSWCEAVPRDGLPSGRYWIGFWKQSKPTPSELAWRGTQFEGSEMILGDGNSWRIPAAGLLPATWKLNRDGVPELQIKAEFREYFERSKKWFMQFIEHDIASQSISLTADVWDYLYQALSLNYRLVPELVGELELWNRTNIIDGLIHTIEGLNIQAESEAQKKSDIQHAG